jgi:hypothetical protein
VGASVPLKSGRSIKADEKKRRMFDIAFTVLTVNDLFTGGYSASKDTSSSSLLASSHCPSVSVLRSVSDDLVGMRCFPSASRGEEEFKGEGIDSTPVMSTVSVVIWAGSQLAVVSFSMERYFSEGSSEGQEGRVTPVTALFTDDVGSRGPLISVDIVHYSVTVTNDHVNTHTDVPPSSSSLAVHLNLPDPPSGVVKGSMSVQSTLLQSHSTLAALDSFGMFKCIDEYTHTCICTNTSI